MSSPKAAAAKTKRRAKPPARAAAQPTARLRTTAGATASAQAERLAAEIEHALSDGRLDLLTPEANQALMAALCKNYAAQSEAGNQFAALPQRGGVTPTDVMIMASALLRSANLAVFELGMWQSWTGR